MLEIHSTTQLSSFISLQHNFWFLYNGWFAANTAICSQGNCAKQKLHLPQWQLVALCCVCSGSAPAELRAALAGQAQAQAQPLCCPAHTHWAPTAAPEPGWKQSRSQLMSLHGAVAQTQAQGTIPSQTRAHSAPQHQNKPLCFSHSLFTSVHLQPFGFGLLRSRWQPGACQSFWSFQRHSHFLIKGWRSSEAARSSSHDLWARRLAGSQALTLSAPPLAFYNLLAFPSWPIQPQQMGSVPQVTSVVQNLQPSHKRRSCSPALYPGHWAAHGLFCPGWRRWQDGECPPLRALHSHMDPVHWHLKEFISANSQCCAENQRAGCSRECCTLKLSAVSLGFFMGWYPQTFVITPWDLCRVPEPQLCESTSAVGQILGAWPWVLTLQEKASYTQLWVQLKLNPQAFPGKYL